MSTDWLVNDALAPDPSDAQLAPLYAGAARGALTLPFCASCGQPLELDQRVCDGCRSSTVAWRDVEKRGVVHAATLVHRLERGLIVADGPYPVLDIEVSSGHRVVMATLLPTAGLPELGSPVAIGFRHVGDAHLPAAELLAPIAYTAEVRS